jgi:hypothetical protein
MFGNHGETVDAGIDQKALEASHSRSRERFDVTLIIVNHPAPCCPVDAASAVRSRPFGAKGSHRSCRRKTVQRHVDQQRVASGSCSSRRGFEALPLCAPRIVDMNVGIDQARKDDRLAEVMDLVSIRYLIGGDDSLNPLSVDKNSSRTNSVRSNYSSSDEGLQAQKVGSLDDCRERIASPTIINQFARERG